MSIRRQTVRWILSAALFVLIACICAPFIQAGPFRQRIQDGLERAMRRKVEIGKAHFSLFGGPGFVVENVIIHEDPSAGIEPFAHVASLEARIGISTLWAGRLEFSRLRLVEPRVNLVRTAQGPWNVAPLVLRGPGKGPAVASEPPRFPAIEVEDARINFKFGLVKSPFYLSNADLEMTRRSGGGFDIRFTGEPSRTDRTAHGFGTLTGGGVWIPADPEPRLDLRIELEKSSLVEMTQLLHGRDHGLHGLIASEARLAGPISNLKISGVLSIEDIHRWDLMPGRMGDGWRVNYTGRANWGAQHLELAASAKENPGLPIAVRVRLHDWLTRARWAADVTLADLPAAALVAIASHLGAPVPTGLQTQGLVSGVAAYGSAAGLQGQAAISNATIKLAGTFEYRIRRAELLLQGTQLKLEPALVETAGNRSAIIEANLDGRSGDFLFKAEAHALEIRDSRAAAEVLFGEANLPLFAHLRGGSWSGSLFYRLGPEGPPLWTGDFAVKGTQANVPGLADPVRVVSANVRLDGARAAITRLRARAGDLEIDGEYRYEPGERRDHRFRFHIPEADVAEIERVLLPTLHREQGFLARTFRRRVAVPRWLQNRHAAGTLRIDSLEAAGVTWSDVHANLAWDTTDMQITGLQANLPENGEVEGAVNINLQGSEPRYRMKGRVRNMGWKEGSLDLEGAWETLGTGRNFLANLRSEGTFEMRSVAVLPEARVRLAAGDYVLVMSRVGPRVTLKSLSASMGTERYSGQGATQADGRLTIDLASGTRVMRVAGPLLPLKLDVVRP